MVAGRSASVRRNHRGEAPFVFGGEEFVPVNKACLTEHPEVRNRSFKECDAIRLEHSIHITCKETTWKPRPIVSLDEAPFLDDYMDVIRDQGITAPSPIQMQGWPVAVRGYDLIAVAETGSGKTLAYVLPMLSHIQRQPALQSGDGPIGLIVLPNRELCYQVLDTVNLFQPVTKFNAVALTGGEDEHTRVNMLLGRADILVACPGRLLDMLATLQTNLRRTTFIVFDEADDLFSGNFAVQVEKLMAQMRPDRQVLLFSATWPEQVERIEGEVCKHDPCRIVAGSTGLAACKNITQIVKLIGPKQCPAGFESYRKIDALCEELERLRGEKVLVFCNTKDTVTETVKELQLRGLRCEGFSSECTAVRCGALGGESRAERLKRFMEPDSNLSVLVCTQVLGRGHDFKNLGFVINYDMPQKLVEYVHRIGRTGRAGKKGIAITLLENDDLWLARALKDCLNATNQIVDNWLEHAAKKYYLYKRPMKKPVVAVAAAEPSPHAEVTSVVPVSRLERISKAREAVMISLKGTGIARIRGYL